MIRCRLHHLEARCRARGYTLEEARPCIVSEDGDKITIDVDHPAYPLHPKPGLAPERPSITGPHGLQPAPQPVTGGPGTELKAILQDWLGIKSSPTCSCNARARQMDEWGPDECKKRLPEIVDWLEQEAKKRRMPFVRLAGQQMVLLAIRRARKAAGSPPPKGHKTR